MPLHQAIVRRQNSCLVKLQIVQPIRRHGRFVTASLLPPHLPLRSLFDVLRPIALFVPGVGLPRQ